MNSIMNNYGEYVILDGSLTCQMKSKDTAQRTLMKLKQQCETCPDSPRSLVTWGIFYLDGFGGFEKNYDIAAKYFAAAGSRGCVEATYYLVRLVCHNVF